MNSKNENAKSREKYIKECFDKANLPLSDRQAKQFLTYYELLVEKNRVMNLTAITEFEDVVQKHFLDSVLVCCCDFQNTDHEDISNANNLLTNAHNGFNSGYNSNNNVIVANKLFYQQKAKLIDVGSGAGFPGIPLKILFPDLDVVLLDSLNKRVQFLNEVILKLELSGITAVHGRAEDAAFDSSFRERFDICVSRAVANLSSLSEYCLPFVKRGGMFIAYKSAEIEKECEEAKKAVFLLGGSVVSVDRAKIPDTDIERSFVFIRKERGTPAKYPRKAGTPTKSPLS